MTRQPTCNLQQTFFEQRNGDRRGLQRRRPVVTLYAMRTSCRREPFERDISDQCDARKIRRIRCGALWMFPLHDRAGADADAAGQLRFRQSRTRSRVADAIGQARR